MEDNSLSLRAAQVLKGNDQGKYTQPAANMYPHQWLWDSCFIAIGLRHVSIERAETELKSLLRGQWHNGMLPNIIFKDGDEYRRDRNHWRSWVSEMSPAHVATSGCTQPPMLAEAVVRVGEGLTKEKRKAWYKLMYPHLVDYHQWLYKERDPHGEGLVLQITPYETGLDNTPPWMNELRDHLMPTWIRFIENTGLTHVINWLRTDTKTVPLEQRALTSDSLAMYTTNLRLRRKAYDINRILDHSLFSIEDLNFNSILIRANSLLGDIAKEINEQLPPLLATNIKKTETALDSLWDEETAQYYSRDFVTHRLLKVPSIATLLPLYAGSISKTRATELVSILNNQKVFGSQYPVPSVPLNSNWFNEKRYWQGPSWINTNWLIIDGLRRYGFNAEADTLKLKTLEMVNESGFYEYFNPITGEGLGAPSFSWTAALVLDLIKS